MSLTRQLQGVVSHYITSGAPWPATTHQIAEWAIRNKQWDAEPSSLVDICANQLARAMRDEYITDPQGRTVRAKHAARVGNGDAQKTLWADIRTGSRPHMSAAFQQRRRQIVGDCRQLKVDVDSYNDNKTPGQPIQMEFDFTPDLREAEAVI